jgi:hypothetical protein
MREYHFYVYILQSASRRALYIGMTNNLRHRVFQHKTQHFESGFSSDKRASPAQSHCDTSVFIIRTSPKELVCGGCSAF